MFDNRKNQSEAARSVFMSSMFGLANTAAATAAFLGGPLLYERSIRWIVVFTVNAYGEAWVWIVEPLWFVLVLLLVFFIARATLATALVTGGLAIAARLL